MSAASFRWGLATVFAVALVLLTLVPLAAQDVVVAIGPDTSYDAYYYDTHEGQIWTWSPGAGNNWA